jgi:osmotically-inducible protein OsmY
VAAVSSGIDNSVQLRGREIERGVKKAFERLADLHERSVWAKVDGSVVTLHGSVRSFTQRQSAQRAAETARV